MTTGLYVHIPFCRQKCNYCDFASYPGQEALIPAYLAALEREASLYSGRTFQTLYIGGGTPSLLSAAQLQVLCDLLARITGPFSALREVTCEANPESLTPQKLTVLKAAGVERLSIGLQSWHDEELKTLGRIHTREDFLNAYQAARQAGFTNINIDLIAGLPGQTLDSFLNGLAGVLSLRPQHISVYGLQIEEGTPFFERGVLCDQLLMRRMLEETHRRLCAAGFEHYEISNFALPGCRALHNTHYWQNGEYVGLGAAAVSYLNGRRSQNTANIVEYIQKINRGESAVVFEETLEGKAKLGESLMLGLRQLDGFAPSKSMWRAFGKEIDKHIQNGLLAQKNNTIKLTFEGLFLANEVFYSFVAPFEDA